MPQWVCWVCATSDATTKLFFFQIFFLSSANVTLSAWMHKTLKISLMNTHRNKHVRWMWGDVDLCCNIRPSLLGVSGISNNNHWMAWTYIHVVKTYHHQYQVVAYSCKIWNQICFLPDWLLWHNENKDYVFLADYSKNVILS